MNIDRFDSWTENALDKLDRGSKWIAWGCAAIMLYVMARVVWG
jgi:hypothetical protein